MIFHLDIEEAHANIDGIAETLHTNLQNQHTLEWCRAVKKLNDRTKQMSSGRLLTFCFGAERVGHAREIYTQPTASQRRVGPSGSRRKQDTHSFKKSLAGRGNNLPARRIAPRRSDHDISKSIRENKASTKRHEKGMKSIVQPKRKLKKQANR